MPDRPMVAVQTIVPRLEDDEPLYELDCSDCGPLSDLSDQRHVLQREAYIHAEQVHDGDVDRDGWA